VNTEGGGKLQPDYVTIDKNGNRVHDTDTIGHAIQDFLGHYSDKAPFCLSVSFKAPHEQDGDPPVYVVQDKYKDYYKDEHIPEPVTADPKYWKMLPDFFSTDSNFGRARWKGLFGTKELFQENVKNYYRLITGVDDVIGAMVGKLKQMGMADNTIIILMGDNGMFLGEHGMEGKWYGYEESVRVPFFIYDPALPDALQQIRAKQIALNIDIAPTILGMAGIKPPATMQGVDLIKVLENKLPARNDFFYQYYFLGGARLPMEEGVVSTRFKYMNYIEHGYEELFDLWHDPHETRNLADSAAYRMQLMQCRERYQELKQLYGLKEYNNKMTDHRMNEAF
jgi:arylsulfatase A-like enzyme